MEDEITAIQLKKSLVRALKEIKKHSRETYNETILGLIAVTQKRKEFDLFVQRAQEHKMKELWGERDYSGWEHA